MGQHDSSKWSRVSRVMRLDLPTAESPKMAIRNSALAIAYIHTSEHCAQDGCTID